jgi:hypothetical protein
MAWQGISNPLAGPSLIAKTSAQEKPPRALVRIFWQEDFPRE